MDGDQAQPLLARDAAPSAEQRPSSYRHQRWSWWQALTFSWASPLLSLGSQRQLQQEDLFTLPQNLQPDACGRLLWQTWEQVSCWAGWGRAGRGGTRAQCESKAARLGEWLQ